MGFFTKLMRRISISYSPAVAAAALMAPCVLSAKTVAWYRFEENTNGTTVGETTVFTNTIDAAKFPAYAGVCNFGGNGRYAKSKLVYTADKMPYGTNAFPSAISLVSAADSACELSNNGAIALNMGRINNKNSPHAQLFIDDDEALRLQTFTLEFFARMPDTTEGYRCLVSRCGGVYEDKRTAFNLYGQLFGSGKMYLQLKFASVENPLYNSSGVVTNQVLHTVTYNYSGSHIDNDRWHHIAIVVDGTAKTVSTYVDYVRRGSVESYAGDIYYEPGYPIGFGGFPQCTYYSSAFAIDEVRISDEALSADEMLKYKRASAKRGSPSIDGNTLLYFPFEGGTESVTVGDGDMQTPKTFVPYLENQAVNSALGDVSLSWKTSSVATDSFAVESDVEGPETRFGLRADDVSANAASIHLMTNTPMFLDTGTLHECFTNDFTFEFFFKGPSSGFSAATDGQTHMFSLWTAFQILTQENKNWKDKYIWAIVGGKTLATKGGTEGILGYFNNKWHHCALVYDRGADRADMYFDYGWKMGADVTPFSTSRCSGSGYWNGLILGGSYWGAGKRMGDFRFDEVRLTQKALKPYQFLTTKAVEDDLLARSSFEDNLVMTPYTNFFGAAGTASAFVSGASAPAYSRDVPARVITAGKDGETLMERNMRSLEFNGGKVAYPKRALLADTDEFTVEFFLKSSSAAAGAGIMRVNRASESDVTEEVTWALSFANASGSLRLKVDTESLAGQTHDFSAAFADGLWHHVGLQFSRSGGDTLVSLYRDAELVGGWTATGRLVTCPRELNFMMGAGEDAAVGFSGKIDELRVSPGVVAPSVFLTPFKCGGLIIIR